MNNKRRDLVILEGPNASGKSTIFKALQREADYQLLVLDRFLGSHIVFDWIRKRSDYSSNHYLLLEEQLKDIFNPLVVYLHAPLEVLRQRHEFRNFEYHDLFDHTERNQDDFTRVIEVYNTYLDHTPLDVMRIDTSEMDTISTVRAIIHHLDERRY